MGGGYHFNIAFMCMVVRSQIERSDNMFPYWGWRKWAEQFTQPLIFDDSMSILQKLCAIWYKLEDLEKRVKALEDKNG